MSDTWLLCYTFLMSSGVIYKCKACTTSVRDDVNKYHIYRIDYGGFTTDVSDGILNYCKCRKIIST